MLTKLKDMLVAKEKLYKIPEIKNKSYKLIDFVTIPSSTDTYNITANATDYALLNGVIQYEDKKSAKGVYGTGTYLTDTISGDKLNVVDGIGRIQTTFSTSFTAGVCPKIEVDVDCFVAALFKKNNFNIQEALNEKSELIYRTLDFGEFPKNMVDEETREKLEDYYRNEKLKSTGKVYQGHRIGRYDGFIFWGEYELDGKRYVPVLVYDYGVDSVLSNGYSVAKRGERIWLSVEPITWIIENWEDLPKEINPFGRGKADIIALRAEDVIIGGIPSNCNFEEGEKALLWLNSDVRGYLNGIRLGEDKGLEEFIIHNAEDFSFNNQGFLNEALDQEIEIDFAKVVENKSESKRLSRLTRLNPDDTEEKDRRQMTDKELIQSWVDAGQSVLLRGPSGIGKTEKLKELYPDLIYLKLTNNMFPEKVVGSMNLQTGQSIPPDFAKQAILACATNEERALVEKNIQNLYKIADDVYERSKTAEGKVVIMLDELLNVKPAVQSLVYTLVLNKIVENGNGMKLPANTVIVATGNQKKYSSVAEDLAEPLEKRFDHIYDMQPKVGEWIYEYAIPNNIHPSVVSYVLNKYMCQDKSEEISDMGYFYEEPEIGEEKLDNYGCKGRTNDPRGWTSISNMLYSFEDNLTKGKYKGKDVEHILDTSLKSKLREEWATDFMDFYNNPTISVEDVVAGNYAEADLPQDINERFAYVSGLIGADEKQLPKVRDFIRKYCDPEYVELYDITWVGKSEERAEQLAEVKSWQDTEWKIEREEELKGESMHKIMHTNKRILMRKKAREDMIKEKLRKEEIDNDSETEKELPIK